MAVFAASHRSPGKWGKACSGRPHSASTQPTAQKASLTPIRTSFCCHPPAHPTALGLFPGSWWAGFRTCPRWQVSQLRAQAGLQFLGSPMQHAAAFRLLQRVCRFSQFSWYVSAVVLGTKVHCVSAHAAVCLSGSCKLVLPSIHHFFSLFHWWYFLSLMFIFSKSLDLWNSLIASRIWKLWLLCSYCEFLQVTMSVLISSHSALFLKCFFFFPCLIENCFTVGSVSKILKVIFMEKDDIHII